jgi:hypothetical protein
VKGVLKDRDETLGKSAAGSVNKTGSEKTASENDEANGKPIKFCKTNVAAVREPRKSPKKKRDGENSATEGPKHLIAGSLKTQRLAQL